MNYAKSHDIGRLKRQKGCGREQIEETDRSNEKSAEAGRPQKYAGCENRQKGKRDNRGESI